MKLWKHQELAIEAARNESGYGLFFDVGTGKSCTAIQIAREKFKKEGRVMRMLILCPPIVIKQWVTEWAKFSKVKPEAVTPLYGPSKKRAAAFKAKAFYDGIALGGIFITNYEALLMKDLLPLFEQWQPEFIIYDEMHKLKDMKSKRTKVSYLLSMKAKYRLGLTGTPVLNSPTDLFSQFLILDHGKTFGKNFFVFRNTYFRDKNANMPRDRYFPNWVIMEGALEHMNRLIKSRSMTAKKSECLDLPPYIRIPITVEMEPDQKKAYEEMKKDFLTYVEGKECVATMAMTKALRLMQISSGFARTYDGKDRSFGITPKQEALMELLETMCPAHKVIVWASWRENYVQIRDVCNKLGLRFVELHGDASGDRFENVRLFNESPDVSVLIGHPGSGGVGVNLTSSDISIFYSRTFSLEHDIQAEARNYRGGSERHQCITRYDLITAGSIDEMIAEQLQKKQEISIEILKDLKDQL